MDSRRDSKIENIDRRCGGRKTFEAKMVV